MDSGAGFLPDFIEDQLPEEARLTEHLRRTLLDWFGRHGYRYVGTPMIEHIDTLLTGAAEDLDQRTFKFTDSLSGRTLGIRADITPQTARVDAKLRGDPQINRLCYCGPVLHATPSGIDSGREPLQIGAELYGSEDHAADWECVDLSCSSLREAGFADLHVALGHAGIFAHVMRGADDHLRERARRALARRDLAPLREGRRGEAPPEALRSLDLLIEMSLDDDPLARLRSAFPNESPIAAVARSLERLADALAGDAGISGVGIDFCALAGYGYHTGMVFDVHSGRKRMARGGRYDGAHKLYDGRRPAVGFSMDLKQMAKAAGAPPPARGRVVAVPVPGRADKSWRAAVRRLRKGADGIRFVPAGKAPAPRECDARLVRRQNSWTVTTDSRAARRR